MRLGLSSAAAPDLSLADLLGSCQRRGLAALELVLGDAHGIHPAADAPQLEAALRHAEDAGIDLAAIACPAPDAASAREALRLAAGLAVPAILPVDGPTADAAAALLDDAAALDARVLLGHGTDPRLVERLRRLVEPLPEGAAALAWEVDPRDSVPADVPAVIAAAGPQLAYVRLRGGGPESAEQTGLGVGAMMARLALARYSGPLVLTPSTPKYRYAWRAWLGQAGGWGCGSKQAESSLVTLAHVTRE